MKNKVINPEDLKKPIKVDTFRIRANKEKIIFDYGKKQSDNIEVQASFWIEPKLYMNFLIYLLQAGLYYEKKYEKDIGLSTIISEKDNK